MKATPREFLLAGKAIFTIRNTATGQRFTYRVSHPEPKAPYFVSVLTGADNENSYSYLGCIFDGVSFRTTAKSKISKDAPSAKAFSWMWTHIDRLAEFPSIEFFHMGKCGCCGRTLTTPESIEYGIGPECRKRQGL